MNQTNIYIAMFRALDCLYDETKNEELGEYLSAANPYLFKDRMPADKGIWEDFAKIIDSEITSENAYNAVKEYLQTFTNFATLFEDITIEEWQDLCDIVCEENKS